MSVCFGTTKELVLERCVRDSGDNWFQCHCCLWNTSLDEGFVHLWQTPFYYWCLDAGATHYLAPKKTRPVNFHAAVSVEKCGIHLTICDRKPPSATHQCGKRSVVNQRVEWRVGLISVDAVFLALWGGAGDRLDALPRSVSAFIRLYMGKCVLVRTHWNQVSCQQIL